MLHPKMLLFWSSDKTAELWVGSHNWTNRAILGLNVEASIVVKMKDSSPLFYEAAEYLNKTRSICEEFDLSKVEFYKELQKSIQESTVPVIEVEASQAHSLAGMEITIFGNDLRDLDELGTFRKEVYLSATENSGNVAEFIYPAEIRQTGALNSANPTAGTLSFSARRHAFRLGRRLPELLPHGDVAQSSLMDARYFVTLELQQSNPLIEFSYPRARKATWEVSEMSNSPLIRRLGVNERALLFRDRTPRLKVPTVGEEETAYGLTLYERRNLSERNFVTKRVVKER